MSQGGEGRQVKEAFSGHCGPGSELKLTTHIPDPSLARAAAASERNGEGGLVRRTRPGQLQGSDEKEEDPATMQQRRRRPRERSVKTRCTPAAAAAVSVWRSPGGAGSSSEGRALEAPGTTSSVAASFASDG